MYHAKNNINKAGITILITRTVDFGAKKITRDREEYYI